MIEHTFPFGRESEILSKAREAAPAASENINWLQAMMNQGIMVDKLTSHRLLSAIEQATKSTNPDEINNVIAAAKNATMNSITIH